jgi:hypothetical protein
MGSGLLRFRVALTARAAPAAAGDARADRDGRVPDGSSILRGMGRRIQPWQRRPLVWLVLVTLVGCSSTAGVEEGDLVLSGRGILAGFVAIGPICPVEQEGVPCPVPPEVYAGVDVIVGEMDGDLVARVDLDDEGRYRVDLPAGRYRVTLDHELGIDRGFSPTHEVDIRPGRTTELDFDIDTGIR